MMWPSAPPPYACCNPTSGVARLVAWRGVQRHRIEKGPICGFVKEVLEGAAPVGAVYAEVWIGFHLDRGVWTMGKIVGEPQGTKCRGFGGNSGVASARVSSWSWAGIGAVWTTEMSII